MKNTIDELNVMTNCSVCSNTMEVCFTAEVLNKYQVQYEYCETCGFLRAHEPHWLEEAYTSAIANADTGLVARNIAIANKLIGVLYWVLKETGQNQYLDAAGGYGMLTRLMRDFGFDFYWHDPYCTNILALSFEYSSAIGSCNVVTAMEVLEHVTDPVAFIKEMFSFSTGQHISFYQRRTLVMIAQKLGLYFASANGIHVISKTPINEYLLGIVTGRLGSRIAPFWIRKKMNSKMMSDHQLILQKIGKEEK